MQRVALACKMRRREKEIRAPSDQPKKKNPLSMVVYAHKDTITGYGERV